MHRKWALLIVGLVLATGIGSAELLGSFGVLSGTAEVEGPTFYAGSGDNLYRSLENAGSYTVNISDTDPEKFSIDFGEEVSWYDSEVNMSARAKGIETGSQSRVNLTLSVNNLNGEELCSRKFEVAAEPYEPALDDNYKVCSFDSRSLSGFEYVISVDEGQKARLTYDDEQKQTFFEVNAQ